MQGPPREGMYQGPPPMHGPAAPGQFGPPQSSQQAPPPMHGPAAPGQFGPPQSPPQAPPSGRSPGPPQGRPFGAPSHTGSPRPKAMNAIGALAAVSLIAVVCGLFIKENGRTAWDAVNAWGVLAILGALLTVVPALGSSNLSPLRAWQVSACGAGALALFWVLFVLPNVGSNTSLALTIGVAAGLVAAWLAPGRERPEESPQPERQRTW